MFKAGYDCQKPLVCEVHGHVMGGGLGLVSVADIVIAQEDTKFCFSEVKLGLVPAVISSFVLAKSHHPELKELLISGRLFGVEDAAVQAAKRIYPDAELFREGHMYHAYGQDGERLAYFTLQPVDPVGK